jgi:hypothetical protein
VDDRISAASVASRRRRARPACSSTTIARRRLAATSGTPLRPRAVWRVARRRRRVSRGGAESAALAE